MKIKYQGYLWDGTHYAPVTTPIYPTPETAIAGANKAIADGSKYVTPEMNAHCREKPTIAQLAWWCAKKEEKIYV